MMSTALVQGLEIILLVSLMTIILTPVLCWLLPDRIHAPKNGKVA